MKTQNSLEKSKFLDFFELKKTNRELQQFIATRLRRPLDKVKTMTLQTIFDAVLLATPLLKWYLEHDLEVTFFTASNGL